jgi:hypothetical protein
VVTIARVVLLVGIKAGMFENVRRERDRERVL